MLRFWKNSIRFWQTFWIFSDFGKLFSARARSQVWEIRGAIWSSVLGQFLIARRANWCESVLYANPWHGPDHDPAKVVGHITESVLTNCLLSERIFYLIYLGAPFACCAGVKNSRNPMTCRPVTAPEIPRRLPMLKNCISMHKMVLRCCVPLLESPDPPGLTPSSGKPLSQLRTVPWIDGEST